MDHVLFFLLATFWGGSFVAIKFVVERVPPVFGAAVRVGLSLFFLTLFFKLSGSKLKTPLKIRSKMWLTGVFAQGLPFCLLFYGEQRISPGLAGIINGTVPLWASLIGLVSGLEEMSLKKFICLIIGFSGIACIFVPIIVQGGSRSDIVPTCAVFMMAISYAVGALLTRRLLTGRAQVDFRANIFHQHCASLTLLLVISGLFERWPGRDRLLSSPQALLGVLYLGLFSTAVAWIIYYHLIREWGAVRASAVTYVAPVIALFWDFVFFRNLPTLSEVIGAVTVLASIIFLHSSARPAAKLASKELSPNAG